MLDAIAGILRKGVRRSRTLTELGQSMAFEFEHPPDGPVVLVHAMTETGSAGIVEGLLKRFPRANVYHTHYLNPATIRASHEQSIEVFRRTGRVGLPQEFLAARTLAARLRGTVRAPWKVVTPVRDPMARTVAAFFHRFPVNHPEYEPGYETDPTNVDRLIDLFLRPSESERSVTLEWFDNEVQEVFGLDAFAVPFEGGRAVLRGEKCSLLLVRAEDLEGPAPAVIGEFLGVPAPQPGPDATAPGEAWEEAHRAFVERIRLPKAYLDVMYGSRLARHFYSEPEIAAFRDRWAG